MIGIPGTPVNINGRTGTAPGPATVTVTRVAIPMPPGRGLVGTNNLAPATTFARYLRVTNLDATNNLLIGFLDGTQSTVLKGAVVEFSGNIPFFSVQASASTVQWEAFAVVAA